MTPFALEREGLKTEVINNAKCINRERGQMRKLLCATAAAIVLGATGAAADYDYVDAKGYRHWDHTGTDATNKPTTSATPKVSERRPAKPLIAHGTPPVAHEKSGDESSKAKADRDALFQKFQNFLFAAKPTAVEPPKSEPTPEPQPTGNDGQQKSLASPRAGGNIGITLTSRPPH